MNDQSDETAALAPAPDVSDEDWEIRFGFNIHDCSRLRRIIYDAALRPLGLTRSQAWVIAYLSRKDGMAQSELASQLDLGKVALGGLIDRLESSGLVERRADSDDRRVKRIFLTAAGRDLVARIRVIATAVNADILEGVSAAEVRAATVTLMTVKRNLLKMLANRGLEPGAETSAD